jgi:SAM-dependent methyltransferase
VGFDGIASRYDGWYEKPANRLIDRLERRGFQNLLPSGFQNALLLDLGSGTGHWFPLAEGLGYKVVGIDISAAMLRVAASKPGMGALLIQGDAQRLPFPDACFDAVLSVTTLEFVRDPKLALGEMIRCLKPGGSLVVGVLNAWSFLGLRRKIGRSRTFREARFFAVGEIGRMLAGLGNVRIGTCAFMPPWSWLVPVGEHLERLGSLLAPGLGNLIVAGATKPGTYTNCCN